MYIDTYLFVVLLDLMYQDCHPLGLSLTANNFNQPPDADSTARKLVELDQTWHSVSEDGVCFVFVVSGLFLLGSC